MSAFFNLSLYHCLRSLVLQSVFGLFMARYEDNTIAIYIIVKIEKLALTAYESQEYKPLVERS